jgi:hypothetical protein
VAPLVGRDALGLEARPLEVVVRGDPGNGKTALWQDALPAERHHDPEQLAASLAAVARLASLTGTPVRWLRCDVRWPCFHPDRHRMHAGS